jgi:nitrite reductase (NADH) large subunit
MNYVIIGNSAAGVAAAESIRSIDQASRITIVDAESYHVYSRPLIAAHVAGAMDEIAMRFRPGDFYASNRIEAILGRRVTALDTSARTCTLDDGRVLSFDKLLIAAGSVSRFPNIPGKDLPGVFDFWTLDDSKMIAARIKVANVQQAVVIGAGLVGVQAAFGLREAGLDVTMVEMLDYVLPRVLDRQAAQVVRRAMESSGLRIITGSAVSAIQGTPSDGVKGVTLSDGQTLECGLVIRAAGVAPNVKLVEGTPIAWERGILVNEFFETTIPGIYAAGDVAQTHDVSLGGKFVNANWPNAGEQGRVAGLNMAGRATPYRGSISMTSVPVATKNRTLPVFSMGLIEPPDGNGYKARVRHNPERGIYQKLVLRGDRLVGALLVGEADSVGLVNDLIRTQASAALVADSLLTERAPFYYFRRERVRQVTEGTGLSWKPSLSSPDKYEKRFDDARWAEREHGQRNW